MRSQHQHCKCFRHMVTKPSDLSPHTLYGPSSIQESFDNNNTTARTRQLMQTQLNTHNFGSKPSDVNSKTLININTPGYGETPAHLGTPHYSKTSGW